MKFATALATLAVVAFGVTAVVAQQDPIAARKALMKANGQAAGASVEDGQGRGAVRPGHGAEGVRDLPGCRGQDCRVCSRTIPRPAAKPRASPKIWENMADFDAKFAKFGEDCQGGGSLGKGSSTASRPRWRVVGKDCDGCHENYRVKKS